MNGNVTDITADAMAIQEKDAFREQGWLKLIAPAKVNLHLGIGARRADGYHDAVTVMHAINLHDTVYARRLPTDVDPGNAPVIRMVACGDVSVPDIPSESNIASKAIRALADEVGTSDIGIEVRIEKNVPAEGGLGGGSSDAAATLLAAANLWGVAANDPAVERAAQKLGSDVAFFLHGGCSLYEGTGELFVRSLTPSKKAVALVKPNAGVSTAEAYRAFDADPVAIPPDIAENAQRAEAADQVVLFNNLAPASEGLLPELAHIRAWLREQQGVQDALLCGSGATTFAVCDSFSAACSVVAAARKLGHWARTTSFGSIRASLVSQGDA